MPFKNPHPLYGVWLGMRNRCQKPHNNAYAMYGGRGIKVCPRWANSFQVFVSDMGERPEGHSIDRIDVNGDYEPSNCRWASKRTQQRNQRVTRFVEIDGRRFKAVELADLASVKTDTIVERANRGLPLESVISNKKLHNLSGLALGGQASGRKQKAKTHCPNGHPYNLDNLCAHKQGYRRCRICHREREYARRHGLKDC